MGAGRQRATQVGGTAQARRAQVQQSTGERCCQAAPVEGLAESHRWKDWPSRTGGRTGRAAPVEGRAEPHQSVTPEPRDPQGHRERRGSAGGRPVSYDTGRSKGRNVVERAFCLLKQWRGLATRYDKGAVT